MTFEEMVEKVADWFWEDREYTDAVEHFAVNREEAVDDAKSVLTAGGVPELLAENKRLRRERNEAQDALEKVLFG